MFHLWENNNPRESKLLTNLLSRKTDKEFRITAPGNGPGVILKALRLRHLYATRKKEAEAVLASVTEVQIQSVCPLSPAPMLCRRGPQRKSRSEGENRRRQSSAGSPENSEGRARHDKQRSTDLAATMALEEMCDGNDATFSFSGGNRKRRRVSVPGIESGIVTRMNRRGKRPKSDGTLYRTLTADDGKVYCLPVCIICRQDRLALIVTLKGYLVDGERIYATGSALSRSGVQRTILSVEGLQRENVLALRCVVRSLYATVGRGFFSRQNSHLIS